MGEKSYVAMEQHVCPICGTTHSHDCGILLDRRLMDSMEQNVVTGYGLCEEHDKLHKEGYIALIEFDPSASVVNTADQTVKMENAHRTGNLCHVRETVFADIFGQVPRNDAGEALPFAFIETGVIEQLQAMQQEAEG